jgi:hypothetical protein
MMKWLHVVCIGLILGCAGMTSASTPASFSWKAEIAGQGGAGSFAVLPLSARVFAETTHGLADMRLFDSQGRETPFVVLEQMNPSEDIQTADFRVIGFNNASGTDELILEKLGGLPHIWKMEIQTTARDFQKNVTVSVSDDQQSWQEIHQDSLFDFSSRVDFRKNTLEIPQSGARYFKLMFQDVGPKSEDQTKQPIHLSYDGLEFTAGGKAAKPFKILSVRGWGGKNKPASPKLDSLDITNFAVAQDKNRNTEIDLGKLNLPLRQIAFEVDSPYFYRRVEILGSSRPDPDSFSIQGNGTIFRFPDMTDKQVKLSVNIAQTQYVKLRIINGDNQSLVVKKIQVSWVRRGLYFIPEQGKAYALFFGGAQARAPSYDIGNLLPERSILMEAPELKLGEAKAHTDFVKTVSTMENKVASEKALLYGIMVLIMIMLSFWIFSLVKQLPPTPPADPQK